LGDSHTKLVYNLQAIVIRQYSIRLTIPRDAKTSRFSYHPR
jgi:hypothetical protein